MATVEEFEEAASKSKTLPTQSNTNLLKLYALYKQASMGDCRGTRPGRFNLRDRAKFDAWESLRGKSQEQARAEYVALVDELDS
jgi:acyl-CoA-binding protein